MKVFEKESLNFYEYLKLALLEKNVELECIFGSKPFNNPIDKNKFLSVMEHCKENYEIFEESVNLDISSSYRNGISNIRCTIDGLESIKKYCREDSLENIDPQDVSYMQKQYYKKKSDPNKKFLSLTDNNYNIRLNLKTETPLMSDHHFIVDFLTDFKNKKKYFRYKKRISFLTHDKLFRIDLTVVKSTRRFKNGQYDFKTCFRESNILKNYEQYELEIEYIGWKENVGNIEIDNLYQRLNEYNISGPSKDTIGNIYDPLNLGIKIYEYDSDIVGEDFDYESKKYTDNTIVKDEKRELYENIIGKYMKIKDEYFELENNDKVLRESIKEYYDRGIQVLIAKEIMEDADSNINILVEFNQPIGNYKELLIPIEYLYKVPSFSPEFESFEYESMSLFEPSIGIKELPSKISDSEKQDQVIEEIVVLVGDLLEENVTNLTKVIYNTDNIISYETKEKVIQKYKEITGQSLKSYKFSFIAPQPVTLTIDYLKVNNPRNILKDYAVTEKADGERYQMIIVDHKGYLINSKKNVIDMNLHFEDYKDGWIFDGEYITKDKYNEPIQLFMVFDLYYDDVKNIKKPPPPLHSFPFISRYGLGSRQARMDDFFKDLKVKKRSMWLNSIKLDRKQYEFGYLTKKEEEYGISKKYEFSEDITGILKASKMILNREKEGYYQYRIDGLIYLPVRYSVRGSIEGLQSKQINGTWNYNFKWKPPEENTIDFQVKVSKTVQDSKVVDELFPKITIENGVRKIDNYKKLELLVGYDEVDDDTMDFCRLILEGKTKGDYKDKETLKIFNHNSKTEEKYNTTNIPLDNGKMVCLNYEKDEIRDGDLVEMRFNKEDQNGVYWEPLRVRRDKTYPQYFTVANNVWSTIIDPITENMITGDYDIKSLVEEKDSEKGKYYVNENEFQLYPSNPLKKLHNYIKSKLINGVCTLFKRPIKIMDLSFGQGGDTQKYINDNFRCSLFVGIDISSNITEACRRFYNVNKKTKGVLFRADTSKNIRSGECSSIEGISDEERIHTETMVSILYGNQEKPIPKEYEKIKNRYLSQATSGFDVISSQFSMHYYFETEDTFNGFMNNLQENVKKNGYFIGTCYDGMKIFEHFKDVNQKKREVWEMQNAEDTDDTEDTDDIEEYTEYTKYEQMNTDGYKVFSIEKKYNIDNFEYKKDDEKNMYGQKIEVYMDSIGQPIVEYLVNFDFFIEKMKENGFELVNPRGTITNIFHNKYFVKNVGQFEKIIENLPEIKNTDEIFRRYYGEAYEMHPKYKQVSPLTQLSCFNSYFIFQKK